MHTLTLTAYFSGGATRGYIQDQATAVRPVSDYRKALRVEGTLPGYSPRSHGCGENGARQIVETARRTIAFMDATGLYPSRARIRLGSVASDHESVWHRDRRYLVTTEPYQDIEKVIAWCEAAGWACAERPAWGMWNPPATRLLLCSPPKRGADLGAILAALDCAQPIPLDDRETHGTVHRT